MPVAQGATHGMARKLGMGILRMIAVIGGVTILAFVMLTAGSALLPGTKMRKLFGASAEALKGEALEGEALGPPPTQPLAADAGTAGSPDAGSPEAPAR